MKIRVALWAFAGVLVATAWWLYIVATAPTSIAGTPALWLLAQLSCPWLLVGAYFHFGVSIYTVFLSNAVVYASMGLLVEMLRGRLVSSHPPAALC